ncbi:MAG TPA: signal peptide peptidase SppA [Sphingomicrobium sp.]|nr:signal peptide peptidase SppA [Sphingomicrobium sp.]
MRFVAAIWKVLVGIKDALVLIAMLMFFGLIYAALSSRPAPISHGVLALDLDGVIVEQPRELDALAALAGFGAAAREHRLSEIIAVLREAKDDDRVKAVALDLDGFLGGGQTSLASLGDALDELRRSGKTVAAFATGYSNDAYQLASHASEIWVPELGAVAVAGPGGSNLYYKGLLDKLGVTANTYRVGEFKSGIEPFTRNDMSPEARENAQALADALLETWKDDVRSARPQAAQGLEQFLGDPVAAARAGGGSLSRAALRLKLVDRIGERRAFHARLAQLGGADEEGTGGFKRIGLAAYKRQLEPDRGPIGVVTVAGEIIDGEAGPGMAAAETIAKAIEDGLEKDTLKALVVRIDSPGGSALASERIRQAILAAREKGLPVVASMGDVAASGGYWVATAANVIIAEPSTITGSIGVYGVLPSFQGTLEKMGVGADGIRTTPLSGEPDLLNGPSPAANALIQAGVEQIYAKFLAITAASRKKSVDDINRIAQGRVWDGGTARQLGLVDGFGDMDEAIARAAALAKLDKDERGITLLEKEPDAFTSFLAGMAAGDEQEQAPADALATLGPAPQALVARALADVRRILAGPTLQLRCLECPPSASVPREPAESGWRDWLLALLA